MKFKDAIKPHTTQNTYLNTRAWEVDSLETFSQMWTFNGEKKAFHQGSFIKELAERYETPLPEQTTDVAELEEKVNAHLQKIEL